MFKVTLIAALLASSAAFAQDKTTFDAEAIKREQRIKDLTATPRSAMNICRRC